MNDIDYRKSSEDVRSAYFKYRKKYGTETTSVVSFVAGWNSALRHLSNNLPTKEVTMRELVIAEIKRQIDNMNDYWKGWGNKDHNIQPYPKFEDMDDETLFKTLIKEVCRASQPMV